MLRSIFWPINVHHIFTSLNSMAGFVTWRFVKKGVFCVRCTYHMEQESFKSVGRIRGGKLEFKWDELCRLQANIKISACKCFAWFQCVEAWEIWRGHWSERSAIVLTMKFLITCNLSRPVVRPSACEKLSSLWMVHLTNEATKELMVKKFSSYHRWLSLFSI